MASWTRQKDYFCRWSRTCFRVLINIGSSWNLDRQGIRAEILDPPEA
jgi:hypothetical protein